MNINHFRYIIAIAEHKNMSRAAKSLYISQPALTKSINLLEEQLGVQLFDRSAVPIEPTYAGKVFLAQAKKMLELNDYLEGEMRAIATSEKSQLTLGIPGERGARWLPHLLPAFSKAHPGVDVKFIEGHSNVLEEKMISGQIDLSFYTLPVGSPDIDFEVLADDPLIIIAARDSEFASQFDLSQNSPWTPYLIPARLLNNQNFLVVAPGSGMRRITEYLLERHGIKYNIKRELYRHETVVRLVSVGDGLAVCPCVTPIRLAIPDKFACFSLDNPVLTRKLIFAYRKNKILTPPIINFINLTKEIIANTPELVVRNVKVIPPLWR
ncbi:MAG: LysR family transcriptional regulator [Clostridiaceae bacterium]|nr:LysR family transcriptional regulator [Clostridiaceae bacterium]